MQLLGTWSSFHIIILYSKSAYTLLYSNLFLPYITDILIGLTSSLDTFQAERNPVPVSQIDTNTDTQAPIIADQSPQDNFSSAIVTSDQPIISQSISHYSSIQTIPSELNPEDGIDLEARLRSSAQSMRKKFASLFLKLVISFKQQGTLPRDLATGILALTQHSDPDSSKPLLVRYEADLKRAESVDDIFDILRPHMTFFNYEILEFLIEEMGSPNDKRNLESFRQEFTNFCRQSVFEIPPNTLGHSEEKAVQQQKFCVKITKEFKVALLVQCNQQATSSNPASSNQEERNRICAPKLDISLKDAKHIQRKLAEVLNLRPSSIYLDSIGFGSVILTFLLPSDISLAGLDSNPDAIALSDIGIHILCGPPGKPERKELTSNGLVVQWSQPEYGCSSLTQYMLFYRSKDSETTPLNDWQKIELGSQQIQICIPDLSDGDTYIFRVSSVSDVGTLQYSDESDPISIDKNSSRLSIGKSETLAVSSADPSSAGLASLFEVNTEDVSLLGDDVEVSSTHLVE
jgi:hypothetical protein